MFPFPPHLTTSLLKTYLQLFLLACTSYILVAMFAPFKARQVLGIHADGKVFMEPSGCLACLYSRVGEPRTLQAACLSACLM